MSCFTSGGSGQNVIGRRGSRYETTMLFGRVHEVSRRAFRFRARQRKLRGSLFAIRMVTTRPVEDRAVSLPPARLGRPPSRPPGARVTCTKPRLSLPNPHDLLGDASGPFHPARVKRYKSSLVPTSTLTQFQGRNVQLKEPVAPPRSSFVSDAIPRDSHWDE